MVGVGRRLQRGRYHEFQGADRSVQHAVRHARRQPGPRCSAPYHRTPPGALTLSHYAVTPLVARIYGNGESNAKSPRPAGEG
jgi:hypothetical protein